MIDDSATIPFPCPGCGEKTEKTVGWLKTNPDSFECSGCGETVHLKPEEVRQVLASFEGVEDAVDRLGRVFDQINKGIKRGH